MIGNEKIWDIASYDEIKAGNLAYELGVSPLVTGVLLQRGFENQEQMREFLYGSDKPFHDPFLMKGMQRAVHRICQALEDKEKITIYGDYDVDGITATSVLYIYLSRLGADVETYIPKRENEGYGLNDLALQNIAAGGSTLVITVDCGISGLGEVERAPQGLDIIITDHHTVPPELPAAYAVIDPKQEDCSYPFKDLCGAGIAFKICQALELGAGRGCWTELLEIVALGTVADIVPLLGENREIVRRGLKAMETTKIIGLKELIKASGCPDTKIDSGHVGFILAPRLNAVGRLSHALQAVELLTTDDPETAKEIAEELNLENDKRKNISNQIQTEAEAMLAERKHIDTCIVLASKDWHPGVIGIVASRLVDKYNLPTILLSLNNGVAKGSCRSIASLNLYEAIAAQSDLLTQFGGHHQAAGLTLPEDKLPEFTRRFTEYVKQKLQPEDYLPRLSVNVMMTQGTHIGLRDLEQLELLEPFGCSNPTPVFAYSQAQLQNMRAIGKTQEHLSFVLNKGYDSYKTVMWNSAYLLPCLYEHMVADVAFVPRKNVWNDEVTVQLNGLSVRQNMVVFDERQSDVPKEELLQRQLNESGRKAVFFRKKPDKASELGKLLEEAQVEIYTYAELKQRHLPETVIFYDMPTLKISSVFPLIKNQAHNLVLLFRNADIEHMHITYPQREEMLLAYKQVMHILSVQEGMTPKEIVGRYPDSVSGNILKIMLELKFLEYDGRLLHKKAVINKCSLEDSPLFCQLQEERNILSNIFNENMRLTQSELLRGRRD